MSNLDFSMAKIAQENSAQYKRAQQNMTEEKKERKIDFSDDEIEAIEKRFLDFSIQTDDKKKKKEIFGKLYVSKKNIELIKKRIITALKIAGAIAIVYASFKGAEAYEIVDTYNEVLNQKMENELTDEQIAIYKDEHQNGISNVIEAFQEIDTAKDSIDSNNYNFLGQNINETDKEYLPFDEDSLINLSEQQQDVIDVATDNVIEEYQGRAR